MNERRFLYVLVISVTLIFLFIEGWSPFYFLTDDNLAFFYPNYSLAWRGLTEEFALPVINFHQFLGQSYFAQGQNAPFYPPVYLAAGLSLLYRGDTQAVIEFLVWMHLAGGACLMFLLLRTLKIDPWFSFGGALLWATNPYLMTMGRVWVFVTYLAVYLPLTFWLLEKFFKKPTLVIATALVLTKVAVLFQGNVQYIFFLGLFEMVYVVAKISDRADRQVWWQKFKIYLLPHLALPLVAAPVLIPTIQGTFVSALRAHSLTWQEKFSASMPPLDFLLAQFFIFRPFAFLGDDRFFFLGLPAVSFLALFLAFSPSRWKPAWVSAENFRLYLYLGCLALILSTLLYGLLAWIPPFDRIRWPFKWFCFAAFFSIVSLGLVLQKIGGSKFRQTVLFVSLILFAVLNLAVLLHNPGQATLGARERAPEKPAFLEDLAGQNQRVVDYDLPDGENRSLSLSKNFATLYGVYQFAGYDPFLSKKASDITADFDVVSNIKYWGKTRSFTREKADLLRSWSVRYLISNNSPASRALLEGFGFKLKRVSGNLSLFEDKNAAPLVMSTPARSSPELKFNVNTLSIDWPSALESPTHLTLNILPFPQIDCLAYLPDHSKKVLSWTDENDRIQLDVPGGVIKVVLHFRDPFLRMGLLLCLAGCFYLILLFFLKRAWRLEFSPV